ncbi:ABC transporter ATP-binding protein [Clostridium chromiireducens]|uniref:ABC transporter ATP-binding protein n=1 Tax=Clostridium chromiireducens TaxID=225345 RepID=A0A1V4IRD3_9CLOT|nr:ABC transporter ATP-binding protein [Clostridium chromiireducens]MVX66104.1 ATP-binding cassette domain-containing protein [Clostridium chromiireducens]OPJ62355.1 macrolide export ATP-binding/permease protein MacB [Clostridium chromiireducens]RII34543.1 ABC transporter ATP-binding protein [Clostridium chromiireducens]
MGKNIIEMKNIKKSFYVGTPNELNILKGIDITVQEGEFVSIIGTSGSGKSTLMNIIGALDRATSGNYVLDGTNIDEISDNGLSEVRNKQIGFVFQTYNLIPRSSALKNVELPMLYSGMGKKERKERAEQLLELVGMKDRMSHQPNELSGGQKQRVAIARALVNDPSIILADEPTGALDSATGRMVMDLFHKIHEKEGKTIVLITHNNELADETQRIITLKDGNIVAEEENKKYYRRFREEEELCL